MPKKEIAILLISSKYPPEYAGSGLRAHRTYKRLKKKYVIEFEVLTSSINSNTIKIYKYEDVPVCRISKKIFRIEGLEQEEKISVFNRGMLKMNYLIEGLLTFFYLWRRRRKFSLFHTFGNNNITSASITFAKIFHIPLIIEITMDTESIYQREIFPINLIIRKLPEKSVLVCISERLKRKCLEMGYKKNQIWCRPNPIDEKKFYMDMENKYKFREKYTKFKKDNILLVYIAQIMPRKNHLFLIEVLNYLPPNYNLFLGGPIAEDGPLKVRDWVYYNDILKKIYEYNLNDRTEIKKGFIEDIDKYIKMSDVYLLPSKREGLGTPMLESIACGVPVVANRIEGITDVIIKEGESGYLSSLNPEEFADKIKQTIKITQEKLKKSSDEILNNYSTKIIDKKYYEFIQNLVVEGELNEKSN